MTKRDLQGEILGFLYECWDEHGEGGYEVEIPDEVDGEPYSGDEYVEALRDLLELQEISEVAGYAYMIRIAGIARAEAENHASTELVEKNERQRSDILLAMAEKASGGLGRSAVHYTELRHLGIDDRRLMDHLRLLERFGYTTKRFDGGYEIAATGRQAIRDYRKRESFSEDFKRIEQLEAQPRGRALQKLLADVIDADTSDWKAKNSVWTTGLVSPKEDTDVLIYKDLDSFNLEAKWEQHPIDADPISKLFSKLMERVDQRGIVASMSGFNENAVKMVRAHMNQKAILLFGRQSIAAIINGERGFEDIVTEKHREFVSRLEILEF